MVQNFEKINPENQNEKEPKPKSIFIVEDNVDLVSVMLRVLKYKEIKVEALTAHEHKTARKIFEENKDKIGVIIMDACLDGDDPDTLDLVKEFRSAGYEGVIIAASSSERYSQELVGVGADEISTKFLATKRAYEIIEKEVQQEG